MNVYGSLNSIAVRAPKLFHQLTSGKNLTGIRKQFVQYIKFLLRKFDISLRRLSRERVVYERGIAYGKFLSLTIWDRLIIAPILNISSSVSIG